jgi:penicillin-binding protein 2
VVDRVVMRPIIRRDPQHRQKLASFLAGVLILPPQEIEARFEKGKAIPSAKPLLIAEDLTMSQVAAIQSQSLLFPELNVTPVQRRNYGYGTMAAHVMGFIGEVNDKDLKQYPDLELALTDGGKVLTRRVLRPADYLDPRAAPRQIESGIEAGGEEPLRVHVDARSLRASGYELCIYPNDCLKKK